MGYNKHTMEQVAIRIIDLDSDESDISRIQQELTAWAHLDSPHIVSTKCIS
jgi:hypothetical protein